MRTVYRGLTAIGKKSGKCACGITRTRTETFSQTVNPFNRNPDGSVKSIENIRAEIEAHREAWMESSIYCAACKPRRTSQHTRPHRAPPSQNQGE